MNPQPMTTLEQVFASDDVEVVKAAFREHLLNEAWANLVEANYQFKERCLDIDDEEIMDFIRHAHRLYKLFGKSDEFIRQEIADVFEFDEKFDALGAIWEAI